MLLRRLCKFLLTTLGVLVILLAVALGVFRLLIGQIPEYQTEIRARVADELGMDVDFSVVDARLGFKGPVLTLRDASIGGGERGGFLQAEQASITLDPFALVLERQVEITTLTLSGVSLTVERDAGGRFRLGEHIIEFGATDLTRWIPQSVQLVIRDSTLRYVDSVRGRDWDFSDLEIVAERTGTVITAGGSLEAPPELARQVSWGISAEIPAAGDNQAAVSWRLAARMAGLDLATLAELSPIRVPAPGTGHGDLAVTTEWSDGALQNVRAELDFEDLQIGPAADDNPSYTLLAMGAGWQRTGPAGWAVRLEDIQLERDGKVWLRPATAELAMTSASSGIQSLAMAADYIRLDDFEPLLYLFPDTQLAEQWALFEPSGVVRDLELSLERRNEDIVYDLAARFEQLAFRQVGSTPGLTGLSGTVAAIEDSGTVDFDSGSVAVDWPALFPEIVTADSLSGAVLWRRGQDAVRLFSVDLALGMLGHDALAVFDLQLPRDGSSPLLDLEVDLAAAELVAAKHYLPTPIMPGAVVSWLNEAIVGGQARDIELAVFGPVASFPFDDDSGTFRVTADIEDATLDYRSGWPPGEDINGRIEFVNAGFAASASGRALSNRSSNLRIDIPDMRRPLLTLTADTQGPLAGVVDYLRGAPLIADELGPDFDRIAIDGGSGAISTRLELPLRDPGGYLLTAALDIADGAIRVDGLAPAVTDIRGRMTADETAVVASDIDALFLGGPVSVSLSPSSSDGYRAEIRVDGETTAEAVAESFNLPHENLLAGQTRWSGRMLLPALDPLATTRTQIVVESNLTGVALRFPAPLIKSPSEPSNLRLDVAFTAADRLEINGNLGATRRFVLAFETADDGLEFASGTVSFGGDEPRPPIKPGLLVNGRLESLELDPWLELARDSTLGRAGSLFLGAEMEIADFRAYGQQLGATVVRVTRGENDWEIDLDSKAIAGEFSVPRGSTDRDPIIADMQRLYLAAGEQGDISGLDPRKLPGIRIAADEFGVGARRLGRLSAVIEPDVRGLVLKQFESATDHYRTNLSGSWFQGSLGTRTTIDARIESTDVQAALAELGLDPVIAGESAQLTANVYWDSAPGSAWLDHLNGEVGLLVETGTLREVDPGAGRVVGLMSIAALPRRLALDFRDVFEDGFAFDEITGGFRIIDGNAYTDNLKLDGPAAAVGVVGRTGLRDQDYTQQIVVSSEPGNMLPTVAGLLGGPGAGAALFVFTRLFKKPLKVIGSVSYCLTGSWEEPSVDRIDNDATDQAADCADLPEEMLSELGDD